MVLGGYYIGVWLKVRSCFIFLFKMGICWLKLVFLKYKDEFVSLKLFIVVLMLFFIIDYELSIYEIIFCEVNCVEVKRNIFGVELIGDLLCFFILRVLIVL